MSLSEGFNPAEPLHDEEMEAEATEQAALFLRRNQIVAEYEQAHQPQPEAGPEKCGYRSRLTGKICIAAKGHKGAHDLQREDSGD